MGIIEWIISIYQKCKYTKVTLPGKDNIMNSVMNLRFVMLDFFGGQLSRVSFFYVFFL